jgi:hypothetical protein
MESSKATHTNINVFCRFRPMSSTELDCASRLFYRLIDPHTIEVAYPKEGETLQYSFDWVFDITDDQCSVY